MPGEQVGSAYATVGFKVDESGLDSAKSKMTSAVGEMEGKAGRLGSVIGSALTTAAVAGGVALAGIATVGVKSYMDIESAAADAASKMDLSAIAAASGQTTEQAFDSVKEHVMALSDELGQLNTNAFDPTQIATALAGLAAGGFDVASASAADMQDVLALATATNYDLAASASMTMSTMNQFGMGIQDMGRISDVYAMAAGKSAASMTDFDYAMQQAGPVAKGVGMSFEELTARISKLADAGYGGEKSGTALRTAMMALTSPTQTQADTLEKLGLTFDDVDPRVHTFGDTLDLLMSKGADIYDFGEIFGKEGAAIVYSSAQQSAAVKQLTKELENSDGAAQSMAKNMLNTLKGSLDAAMGAASSLAYMIGGKLEPSLRSALDWFSAEGAPAIRKFIEALSSGDWASVGEMVSSAIRVAWEKLKDLGSSLAGWIKSIDYGALGAYIADGIKNAWEGLKDLGRQLLDWLQAVDWQAVATKLTNALRTGWNTLTDLGTQLLNWLEGVDWDGVATTITDAISTGWEILKDIGQTLYDWIDSVDWAELAGSIATKIKDAWSRLSSWASDIIDKIVDDFTAWVDGGGPGKLGEDVARAIARGAINLGKWIYDSVKGWWESNGSSLGGAISSVINFVGVALKAAKDFVVGFAKTVIDVGKGTIGASIVETIGNAFDEIEVGGYKVFGDLGEDFRTTAAEWRETASHILDDIPGEVDTDIRTTFTGDGNPLDADGKTIRVGVEFKWGDDIYKISQFGNSDDPTYRLDKQQMGRGGKEWAPGDTFKSIEAALKSLEGSAASVDKSTASEAAQAQATEQTTANLATQSADNARSSSDLTTSTGNMLAATDANVQASLVDAQSKIDSALAWSETVLTNADELITKYNAADEEAIARITGASTTNAETTTKAATTSGTTQTKGATDSANIQTKGATDSAAIQKNGANAIFSSTTEGAAKIQSSGRVLLADCTTGGSVVKTASVSLGQAGQNAGSALNQGASAIRSAISQVQQIGNAYFDAGTSFILPSHASGTKTTGPEIAQIGEAGTEYVIPADASRPDLLNQAMSDYGIPDTAAAQAGSSQFSNVTGITVVAGGKGAGQSSGVFAALEKAAAMVAEATRYLAQTAEALGGAIEAMASAAGDWASTVRETTAEINTTNAEAAQANIDLALETAEKIKEMQMETADKNKEIAEEIATKVKESLTGGATALQNAGLGAGSSITKGGESFSQAIGEGCLAFTQQISSASVEFAKKLNEVSKMIVSQLIQGAGYARNAMIQGGAQCGSAVAQGGAQAAQALIYAAQALMEVALALNSPGPAYAIGTVTSGPELAWIGEAGKEYVIPTTTKRWDLLYAAMADYGLKIPKAAKGGIVGMASMGGSNKSISDGRIVIEDHTVHELYIDGKKLTDIFMRNAQHKIKARQGALSNW